MKWKIGLVIPHVEDKDAEELYTKVVDALYKITDDYPQYKDWTGFKHHDN